MSKFGELMFPLLEVAKEGKEINVLEIENTIIQHMEIAPQDLEPKPSGKESLFRNRLRWAKLHLTYANLIKKTKKNCYIITPRGKKVLSEGLTELTESYLGKFDEYREKRGWSIKFERRWSMPSKWTFSMQPVMEILDEETEGFTVDPFAGSSTLADLRNDINPESDAQYHMDALEFVKTLESNSADTVYYDGIYSPTQQKREYEKVGLKLTNYQTSSGYPAKIKDQIARIVKPNGKVISFGWNSNGMGIERGFLITRIVLVPHGGNHNDTIITIEKKTNR